MANALDKEQIEMLKEWWGDYGKSIVIAIAVGLVIGFGWRYWSSHRREAEQQAGVVYTQLQNAAMSHDNSIVNQLATNLKQQYDDTAYASMGALVAARMDVEKANLDAALQQTQWVVQNGSEDFFKQVARINAARILLAQKKTDEALKLISNTEDNTLLPLVDRVRGDIYRAQNKLQAAQAAYAKADAGFTKSNVPAPLLKLLIAQA